jgi:hypothetical protein
MRISTDECDYERKGKKGAVSINLNEDHQSFKWIFIRTGDGFIR